MRAIYETSETLAIERSTIGRFVSKWGSATVSKLPVQYRIDWAVIENEEIVAFVETKRRHCRKDQYPTLMLSLAKYQAGRRLHEDTGIPVLVVVEWNDCMGFVRIEKAQPKFGWGGRTDRGDPQDAEPCVLILTNLFRIV